MFLTGNGAYSHCGVCVKNPHLSKPCFQHVCHWWKHSVWMTQTQADWVNELSAQILKHCIICDYTSWLQPSSEPCHVFSHKFGKGLPAITLPRKPLHSLSLGSAYHHPSWVQILGQGHSVSGSEGLLIKCAKLSHATKMSTHYIIDQM